MLIGSPFLRRILFSPRIRTTFRFFSSMTTPTATTSNDNPSNASNVNMVSTSNDKEIIRNPSLDWYIEFLGTSSAVATKQRNVSSLLLKMPGFCMMFDCGEGTLRQMLSSSYSTHDLDAIFITHLHSDHFFGLPGISTSLRGSAKRIPLYTPNGLSNFFVTSKILSSFIQHPISLRDFKSSSMLLFENEKITVKCSPIHHTTFTLGYVIEEKDIRGSFNCAFLKEKGILPGPIYRKFQKGLDHEMEDGSIIKFTDAMGPSRKGKKIVILGDTYDPSAIAPIAMDADILVHEATCSDETKSVAIERGHSTARMAGEFAKRIRAKKLILTHFSPRNFDLSNSSGGPPIQIKGLIKEAMQGMCTGREGDVVAASDFLKVLINKQ